ncbi:MAG: Mur ligase domain-containing protein [Fervidobacterium sp.]
MGITLSDLVSHRFVIDSREVKPNDDFVAVKGNRVDGHELVGESLKK